MIEPRFLEVKEIGDSYVAVPVHIPKPSDDVVKRIGYDSATQYHVEDCLRKANLIENPDERKDFVLSELEVMFG
jgi:hypothetical protein